MADREDLGSLSKGCSPKTGVHRPGSAWVTLVLLNELERPTTVRVMRGWFTLLADWRWPGAQRLRRVAQSTV